MEAAKRATATRSRGSTGTKQSRALVLLFVEAARVEGGQVSEVELQAVVRRRVLSGRHGRPRSSRRAFDPATSSRRVASARMTAPDSEAKGQVRLTSGRTS
jgi:hypothetical protein